MATYYVKTGGSDSSNGLSDANAWATIDKVNTVWSAGTFAPGDYIKFKCGDTFYGTLTVSEAGSSGNPITITSYGTGDKPVITGFTTITGWTDEGDGLYSKTITSESRTYVVTVNNVQYAMGRFPKEGYNTFESHVGTTSITDNTLGESIDWTGAEVVIHNKRWCIYKATITDHTLNTLTYVEEENESEPDNGNGYFIQNDIRCCTALYDWYYDVVESKFYMYFGEVDPSTLEVKVATLKNGFINEGYHNDYITVDSISFNGFIESAIMIDYNNRYHNILNNTILYCGINGVHDRGVDNTIDSNIIGYCNRNGITADYSGTGTIITNNTISNVYLYPGMTDYVWVTGCGIVLNQISGGTVSNNIIRNIGYNGIYFTTTATSGEVSYNYIDNTCLIMDDGGSIYTSGPSINRIIEYNICLNSIGTSEGIASGEDAGEGIYLDENCDNTTVRYNIVSGCSGGGIFLHKGRNNTVTNNIVFDTDGLVLSNWVEGVNNLFNNTISNNKFIARTSTQNVLRFNSMSYNLDIADWIGNYNCYTRPFNETTPFFIHPATDESLSSWKTRVSPQETNSYNAGRTVSSEDDLHLLYNETNRSKYYRLSATMYDVDGLSYSGLIEIEPWTGLVLLGAGTVTEYNLYITSPKIHNIGIS